MALKNPDQLKLLKKKSKYGNVRTNGFASKRQAERYALLWAMQDAGKIKSLETEVRFKLTVCGELICCYVCDFAYERDGVFVIEDVKPKFLTKDTERRYKKTAAYRLFTVKKKLMFALHGIDVREV